VARELCGESTWEVRMRLRQGVSVWYDNAVRAELQAGLQKGRLEGRLEGFAGMLWRRFGGGTEGSAMEILSRAGDMRQIEAAEDAFWSSNTGPEFLSRLKSALKT